MGICFPSSVYLTLMPPTDCPGSDGGAGGIIFDSAEFAQGGEAPEASKTSLEEVLALAGPVDAGVAIDLAEDLLDTDVEDDFCVGGVDVGSVESCRPLLSWSRFASRATTSSDLRLAAEFEVPVPVYGLKGKVLNARSSSFSA